MAKPPPDCTTGFALQRQCHLCLQSVAPSPTSHCSPAVLLLVRRSGPVGLAAVLGARCGARAHLWRMHVYDDRSMTSVTPSTIKEMPMTRDAIATTGNTTAQTPRRPPPSSE
jgi:hypothetical protein